MNRLTLINFRKLTVLAAICALMMVAAHAASPFGDQDFTLVNKTGLTINELYVGPHSSDEWGKDILGEGYLESDHSRDIIFRPGTKAALWDIKLVDENGKIHTRYSLNLLEIEQITVTRKADDSWYWTWKNVS